MVGILVFGTGSVGTVYTCLLSKAGVDVTCVCRSNYAEALSFGLTVQSPIFGRLHSKPQVVQSVAEALEKSSGAFDFIVVTTKALAETTRTAIELLRPAIAHQKTAIVLIQNGLGVEKPFQNAFPGTTIISGVAYLPTTQVGPAEFRHSEVELLHLGLLPGGVMPTDSESASPLHSFTGLLRAAGATVQVHADIQVERWRKLVANAALNPMCALSRCYDLQLIRLSPLGYGLLQDVMLEIVAVAASAGYGDFVNGEAVQKQLARCVSRPYPGVQPSMMADAIAGKALETESILGEIIKTAQESQIQTPRLVTLYVLLKGLDFALRKGADTAEEDRRISVKHLGASETRE